MPVISIIIPCYGVEKHLDRCLNSIVNQTYQDLEIILVDDGSPDKVPQMCDEWAKKDYRIKVIHKQNAGLGFARNSGLEIATGKYVAFVDSDDYVDTKMYETLLKEAEKSDADAVFCGFKTEQRNGDWANSNEVSELTVWNGPELESFVLDMVACAPHIKKERKFQMSVWHSIYRRSVITDNMIKFHSEREVASEDLPFQVDYIMHSNRIIYIPQSFYYYCLNETSLTATFKPEKFERYKVLYYLLNEKLNNINGYRLRTSRFFIGYIRIFLQHLYTSDYKKKKVVVKTVCNDNIWNDISKIYLDSYLSIYPRFIYKMITLKHYLLLGVSCQLISFIKKQKGWK